MALKAKINKAAYDALPDLLKAEYKKAAEGEDYLLDADGVEDVGALKRAKDREAEVAKTEKARADAAEQKLADLQRLDGLSAEDRARKAGDIKTLEQSWQAKMDAAVGQTTEKLTKREKTLQRILVDDTAQALAARISTKPAVLLPHIKARLTADLTGDEPVTRVLDASGKPSALTVEELAQEFVANADFAAIIVASQGSGGGANGGKQSGGGGAAKKFEELSSTERAEYLKRDPAGFHQAVAASKQGAVTI